MKNILAIILAWALLGTLSQGCVTRKKINTYLWLNNAPIPSEICEREPSLKDYGLFRKLRSGQIEFLGFCEEKTGEFFSMHKDDFERIMNGKENAK
jgi:hypothetical protein